jgi:hypothetical protein
MLQTIKTVFTGTWIQSVRWPERVTWHRNRLCTDVCPCTFDIDSHVTRQVDQKRLVHQQAASTRAALHQQAATDRVIARFVAVGLRPSFDSPFCWYCAGLIGTISVH